jgi:hypothetical protein
MLLRAVQLWTISSHSLSAPGTVRPTESKMAHKDGSEGKADGEMLTQWGCASTAYLFTVLEWCS